ncbi:MAG TPA: NADH-quinone oxidoreductase subunit C [Chloroflexota bacterium]|nr:NADH-quinone oxidoreductase subunit C [Chloroflexota bacterium]
MGTAPGNTTPGTQTVPGQTPPPEPPPGPEHPPHFQALMERFGEQLSIPKWSFADGIPTAAVAPENLRAVCLWLRDEAAPRYDFLVELCGADWPERVAQYEVTYIFHSLERHERVRLKCAVGGETPALPSISDIWPAANWPEREVYDMFGVTFDGHPDLRRILTPNDWEGHPLRKSFPLGEEPVEFYRPEQGGPATSASGSELDRPRTSSSGYGPIGPTETAIEDRKN